MKHDDDKFDSVLNDALAPFREAEPLAGLEDRVLRRIQGQRTRQQKLWRQWSIAAAAIAVLAVAVWLGSGGYGRRSLAPPALAWQKTPPAETVPNTPGVQAAHADAAPDRSFARKHIRTVHLTRGELARMTGSRPALVHEQFPMPIPATSEERALLLLARSDPKALQNLPKSDQELAILPITLKPLVGEGAQNQGDN
jgi:hypothetical protein